MSNLKVFVVLMLLATLSSAEYIRSIRIGSFKTDENAKKQLENVENFVKKYDDVQTLKNKAHFEFVTRESGEYYVTVIEPFYDRKTLQKVLDRVRIGYPHTYVTKLDQSYSKKNMKKKATDAKQTKSSAKEEVKQISIPKTNVDLEKVVVEQNISDELSAKLVQEKNVTQENNSSEVKKTEEKIEKAQEIVIKEKLISQTQTPKTTVKKVEKEILQSDAKQTDLASERYKIRAEIEDLKQKKATYKTLFYSAITVVVLLLLLLQKSRATNKKHILKEEKTLQQLNDVYTEIRDKEGYLDQSKVSMASVISYANLLLEFELSTIQRDYVRRILSTSGNLLNTINNTLDLNKIVAGKLHIENENFDLNRIINDVSNVVSLQMKTNHLRFIINVEDDVPTILMGDSFRLKQVLINLVGNSARFTQNGDLTLHVKKLYTYVNAVTLGFKISDTGSGITDEQVKEILSADSQDIKSTDLVVSKKLVEMMQGELKIYNSQEMGTVFTFHIKFNLKRSASL